MSDDIERLQTQALEGDSAAAAELIRAAQRSGDLRAELIGFVCLGEGQRTTSDGYTALESLIERGIKGGDPLFKRIAGERQLICEHGSHGLSVLMSILPELTRKGLEGLKSPFSALRSGLLPRLLYRITLQEGISKLVLAAGVAHGVTMKSRRVFRVENGAPRFLWPDLEATCIATVADRVFFAGPSVWGELSEQDSWQEPVTVDGTPSALMIDGDKGKVWLGTDSGRLYSGVLREGLTEQHLHRDLGTASVHDLAPGLDGPAVARTGGITLVDPDGDWDREMTMLRNGRHLEGQVRGLASQGGLLASASGSGHRWDMGQQTCVGERKGNGRADLCSAVAQGPAENVFTGTLSGWILDWDGHDEDRGTLLRTHSSPVSAFAIADRELWSADVLGQVFVHSLPIAPDNRPLQQRVNAILRLEQGVLSLGARGRVARWSKKAELEQLRDVTEQNLTAAALHPVQPVVALGTEMGSHFDVDLDTLEVDSSTRPRGPERNVIDRMVFSPDGSAIALEHRDSQVTVHAWPSMVLRQQTRGWALVDWREDGLVLFGGGEVKIVSPDVIPALSVERLAPKVAVDCETELTLIAYESTLYQVSGVDVATQPLPEPAKWRSVCPVKGGILLHDGTRLSLLHADDSSEVIWPRWMPPFDTANARGDTVYLGAQGRVHALLLANPA